MLVQKIVYQNKSQFVSMTGIIFGCMLYGLYNGY